MTETRTVPVGVLAVFLAQLSVVPSLAAEYDVGSIWTDGASCRPAQAGHLDLRISMLAAIC